MNIGANSFQFESTIRNYADQYGDNKFALLVKKYTLKLHNAVTGPEMFPMGDPILTGGEKHPVKTGHARANWQVARKPNNTEIEGTRRPPTPVIQAALEYWVFNNVAYIQALEDGHSSQAPTGWVAKAIARFQSEVDEVLKEMGYLK